jgi:uncharacterized damage-inducible protein DinB
METSAKKGMGRMPAEILAKMFEYTHYVITVNSKELTHEDSVTRPAYGGSTLNWIVGHILVSRNSILKLLGHDPILDGESVAPYERGSGPLPADGRVRKFEELLALLNRSQEQIMAGIRRLGDSGLSGPASEGAIDKSGTVGQNLAFFQFHEAYHAGQTGILRRVAGRKGAIQ